MESQDLYVDLNKVEVEFEFDHVWSSDKQHCATKNLDLIKIEVLT